MRELFPPDIDSVHELPWPLFDAISRMLLILSWFENAAPEEMPDRSIWMDNRALSEHAEGIRRKRAREAEDARQGRGAIEDPVDNDAASGLIAGG